jgi:hypothetical protein
MSVLGSQVLFGLKSSYDFMNVQKTDFLHFQIFKVLHSATMQCL